MTLESLLFGPVASSPSPNMLFSSSKYIKPSEGAKRGPGDIDAAKEVELCKNLVALASAPVPVPPPLPEINIVPYYISIYLCGYICDCVEGGALVEEGRDTLAPRSSRPSLLPSLLPFLF